MPPSAGAQLVLPGIAPAKPTMHLAPVKPHVPAAVSGRAPMPPRLDGGFSGMSGVIPRVESNPLHSHIVAPSAVITPATPVVNVNGALRSVVVRPGDSLWKIALKNLGRGSRWQE